MPGPGTYESPPRPATGYRFGSEERKGLGRKSDSPGPGQYAVPSKVGSEGKSIVMAGRYEDKKDINQVGPGQYKTSSTLGGPKFSMGAGEKGTKLNKDATLNPPPGTYTVDANAGRHHSPSTVFGKDKRDKTRVDDMPEPGRYNVPTTMTSKGVKIQGRYEVKEHERAPPPGAYSPNMDPSKVKGGSISFGHEAKGSGYKDNKVPPPGTYNPELKPHGGWTFGKDPRDKKAKDDGPGPGSHDTRRGEGLTYY